MYSKGVWLYDASINYLSGKHIPLFLVAMCFLFLFLPYTLLLLFGQWLQAVSHLRLFAWVNRLTEQNTAIGPVYYLYFALVFFQ